jgi:hypothetical protein
MPKAELGTFGVVAGEELKIDSRKIKISRWGVLFASLACCGGIKGRRCLFRQYAVPAKVLRASQAQRERDLVFDAAQFLCRKETLTHATSNKKEPRATNKQQMRRAPVLMAAVERMV